MFSPGVQVIEPLTLNPKPFIKRGFGFYDLIGLSLELNMYVEFIV